MEQTTLYEAEKGQLHVAAVGDITITDPISSRREEGFQKIKYVINAADVAYGHIEGVIPGNEGFPSHDTGVYVKLHDATPQEVKSLGIDMVSLAGNHSLDYAQQGLLATMKSLDAAGVQHAGTGSTLTEARAPAYFISPCGKIALFSICSYFSDWARAADRNRYAPGRPGINPLRIETVYHVDAQALQELRRISTMLGFEDAKLYKEKHGMYWSKVPDTAEEFHFMTTDFVGINYNKFVLSKTPGVEMIANKSDVQALLRNIKDARQQADWVLLALHSHEGDGPRTVPATFVRPLVHDCIDTGADAIIATGPHVIRGIEIYKNKPILYGLGNFVEQLESVRMQPADFYERYHIEPELTPVEAWNKFTRNDSCGSSVDQEFWEGICASFSFSSGKLSELKIYPLDLGFGKHHSQRGLPLFAQGKEAENIIERLRRLSLPYHTRIDFKDGIGIVKV